MEKFIIELDVYDRCCLEALIENELKSYKPYTKRCCSKVIPSDWNKSLLSILKVIRPTLRFIGEVDLTKDDIWNSINVVSKSDNV